MIREVLSGVTGSFLPALATILFFSVFFGSIAFVVSRKKEGFRKHEDLPFYEQE